MINQAAHLEMQLMQMEGQKEKARGWLGRIQRQCGHGEGLIQEQIL